MFGTVPMHSCFCLRCAGTAKTIGTIACTLLADLYKAAYPPGLAAANVLQSNLCKLVNRESSVNFPTLVNHVNCILCYSQSTSGYV
jgi:hypothetical protein